jgi:hypothetical protein
MRFLHGFALVSSVEFLLACGGGDAIKVGDSGGTETSVPETAVETGDTSPEELDCVDELVGAAEWFVTESTGVWSGQWEFGHTQVTGADETRLAPPVVAERETLVLFTPDQSLDSSSDVRLSAWLGGVLQGVSQVQAPENLPGIQEQGLTAVSLDPYSSEAWSVTIPWNWVLEGVVLRLAVDDGNQVSETTHTFSNLGAPHIFNITRSKIVLFGDESLNTDTLAIERLARDFGGTLPAAQVRLVDSTDWVLEEMVIPTAEGYRMIGSEAERLASTNESNRWSLLKHQFALRMSAANTGRGLVLNGGSEGDSSPYSFGTSVVMGWVVDENGNASDIDNAGVAAGWTGWTALWNYECSNGFTHELGHSQTLYHFTSGTAASWGIGDEYPNDGQTMSWHPWGYDSARREFRTWYQVGSAGPTAGDDEGFFGKRDPMNGGEGANALNCFPQYTGYHSQKIQNWYQDTPTLRSVNGLDGVYLWDAGSQSYQPYTVAENHQTPVAVDVPTVSLIGTLGGLETETQQTYPPLYAISGNVFELPDPAESGHHSEFDGAKWFLEVHYADGASDRALIAVGDLATTDFQVYALNLDARLDPIRVDLMNTAEGYPNMDLGTATLVHSRAIQVPDLVDLAPVVSLGKGQVANGGLTLSKRCTAGVDCATREVVSTWREAEGALTFQDSQGEIPDADDCLERGEHSVLNIPLVSDKGEAATLVVFAQKELETGGQRITVPLNDRTPWVASPDLSQSVRLWVPYEENMDLDAGSWRVYGSYALDVLRDGQLLSQIPITVNLIVDSPIDAEILAEGYREISISQEGSAVYYVVEDAQMGPTGGVWWDGSGTPLLSVPVVDQDSGVLSTLYLDAYKTTAGYWWDFNTAQWAEHGVYDNELVLIPNVDQNTHLESGHRYISPGSSLLVIKGIGWHSGSDLGRFPLRVAYTAP